MCIRDSSSPVPAAPPCAESLVAKKKKIYIVDFGGQYAHLLAQRIRKVGQVFTDIVSTNTPAEFFTKDAAAIVLSGGPQSVFDQDSVSIDPQIFELGIPMLCICYGHQLLCQTLGGAVEEGVKGEYGRAQLQTIDHSSPLLAGVDDGSRIWMSHRDEVSALPPGFSTIASTDTCSFAAVSDVSRQLYGLQFHPEVVHSEQGERMLSNFVDIVGGVRGSWTMDDFVQQEIDNIIAKTAGGLSLIHISEPTRLLSISYAVFCLKKKKKKKKQKKNNKEKKNRKNKKKK
eukprot:TRINITY_DN24508_c0_g1_i1.p1 TRINITY_DN24508_c0_g1~~TRINITY_DN24508_c0_g1_i1.p1  ORF type:complete len:286 (-),score=101.68 TRINITY_DN24508_c0_g1_i1:7-864(-)